jgi:hypothetical protein
MSPTSHRGAHRSGSGVSLVFELAPRITSSDESRCGIQADRCAVSDAKHHARHSPEILDNPSHELGAQDVCCVDGLFSLCDRRVARSLPGLARVSTAFSPPLSRPPAADGKHGTNISLPTHDPPPAAAANATAEAEAHGAWPRDLETPRRRSPSPSPIGLLVRESLLGRSASAYRSGRRTQLDGGHDNAQ